MDNKQQSLLPCLSCQPHTHRSYSGKGGRGGTHLVPDVVICLLNHLGMVVVEVTASQEAVHRLLVGVTA